MSDTPRKNSFIINDAEKIKRYFEDGIYMIQDLMDSAGDHMVEFHKLKAQETKYKNIISGLNEEITRLKREHEKFKQTHTCIPHPKPPHY